MRNADASLYDSDFYLWTQQAAESLRSGSVASDDLEHAAEEIADMGKRDRRELQSRMMVLVTHLIKGAAQPQLRKRQRGWPPSLRNAPKSRESRSEERRVGKECRSRWSPH